MKNYLKLILLSSVMMLWGSAAQAQTCATQPTCADLGYTSTATSDCIGTVLKCPFDTSKIYCAKKADVLTVIRPNYSNEVKLSNNVTYTVGSGALAAYKCVWVRFYSGGASIGGANNYTVWYINEKTIGASASDVTDYIMGFYLLYSGDTFRLKAGMANGNDSVYYYPCKGY